MFDSDEVDAAMAWRGSRPKRRSLRAPVMTTGRPGPGRGHADRAGNPLCQLGGKSGARHTEHLGHLLTQMQWLQRAYPGATVVTLRPATDDIWGWLDLVPDPEIPVISVVDLGIVRDVAWEGDTLVVAVTPTYSGCPATTVINPWISRRRCGRTGSKS
jgi:hypothetical protein